jgi:WD40 repeat protein
VVFAVVPLNVLDTSLVFAGSSASFGAIRQPSLPCPRPWRIVRVSVRGGAKGDNVPGDDVGDSGAAYKLACAGFAAELKDLHITQGEPSLSKIVNKAAEAGDELSLAGISEVFKGRRFPTLDYTIKLVRALTDAPQAEGDWKQRWQEVARLKPARSRHGQSDPASGTSTAELLAERQLLFDTVQHLELRAEEAEARAEAATDLANRLQDALYRRWPVGGVVLAKAKAKARARSRGTGPVLSIAFHPNGRLLAAGYGDGMLRVWDADSMGVHGWAHANDTGPVHSVAFSPTGDILAVGSADGTVRLVLSGASQFSGDPLNFVVNPPIAKGPPIRSVAFGPDNYLAAGDTRGTVRVWQCYPDGESGVQSGWLYEHHFDRAVRSLAFMSHRKLLAAGTDKGHDSASTADLLDFDSGPGFYEKHDMKFSGSPVQSVAFSRSGDLLAIAEARMVHLKSLNAGQPSGSEPHTSITCDKDIQSLAFNPAADHLAIGSGRTCTLYRVRPGEIRRERVIEVSAAVRSLAFCPEGMLLAVGRADEFVQLYGPDAWQI